MTYKDIYGGLLNKKTPSSNLYLLLENEMELLNFLSDLDNQKLTEDEWGYVFKKVVKLKGCFAIVCALIESESVPKHLAFKLAKTIPQDYQLLNRKDLNMEDIKEVIDIVKPNRLKQIIANTTINYKNIKLMCKLPESLLEELDYEPFAKIADNTPLSLEITSRLNKDNCPEKFCTAIINNTRLYDDIRNKAFNIAYDPLELRHITANIARELYPELASAVFREKDFEDADNKYLQKIDEAFMKLMDLQEFDEGYILDLIERYKNSPKTVLEHSLCNIAEVTTSPNILKKIQEATIYARPSIVQNPAYDIEALNALGDEWLYLNFDTPKNKSFINYEKRMTLMKAVFTPFVEKAPIKDNCRHFIFENINDNVLIKTLMMSPCADKPFRDSILNTAKTEKDKLIYKCLDVIAEKVNAIPLDSTKKQFFSFHFLKELFKNDEKVVNSFPYGRKNKEYDLPLTYDDFLNAHEAVERMSVSFTDTEISKLKKIIEEFKEIFPYQTEISNALEKTYETIKDEKFFGDYTSQWSQIFYIPTVKDRMYEFKMDTAIYMNTLNSLKTQPTLFEMFSQDTIKNCKASEYFAEKLYKIINNEFDDFSMCKENTKTLLENLKLLAPVYHQIEEIVMENRFKNKEISETEYKLYRLKFDKYIKDVKNNEEIENEI